MGGPYRAYIKNGEIKVENLLKLNGREASLQWNKAVANKAALNAIINKAKRDSESKDAGNYKIDTGAKTGDITNIQRKKSYIPEYSSDERYDVSTKEYVDDERGMTQDKVDALRQKYDLKGIDKTNPEKQHVYNGKRFTGIIGKSEFVMNSNVLNESLKTEKIQEQIGLNSVNEEEENFHDQYDEYDKERYEELLRYGDFSKTGSVSDLVQSDYEKGIIAKEDRKEVHDIFKEVIQHRNENKIIADNVTSNSKVSTYDIYKQVLNPEFRKKYKDTKTAYQKNQNLVKVSDSFKIQNADKFSRGAYSYMKDPGSKTKDPKAYKEAMEYNSMIADMSESPEGRALLALKSSGKVLGMDRSLFYAKNFDDALEKYKMLGQDADLPFIVKSSVFVPEIEYDPIIAEEIKYNMSSFEGGAYLQNCAKHLSEGNFGIYNCESFNNDDLYSLANAGITSFNTKDYSIVDNANGFIAYKSYPDVGTVVSELEEKGIIGPNSKYFNAMKEYTNEKGETVKERIRFDEAVGIICAQRQLEKNPNGPQSTVKITFEEKTPEQKKALDEALKTIGKPKKVPNPGPVYGDSFKNELEEIYDNFTVFSEETIEKNPVLRDLRESIGDASLDGFATEREGLNFLRQIKRMTHDALTDTSVIKGDDKITKRAVTSFLKAINEYSTSKIAGAAVQKYAKENGIDLEEVYDKERSVPTSAKSFEAKRIDNTIKSVNAGLEKDIKAFSKGKITQQQLAEKFIDLYTLNNLKTSVMSMSTGEQFNEVKQTCTPEGLRQAREKLLSSELGQVFMNAANNLNKNEAKLALSSKEARGNFVQDFFEDFEYNKELANPNPEKSELEALEEENAWLKFEIDQNIEKSCKAIAEAREAKNGDAVMQNVAELIAYSSVKSKIRESNGTPMKLPTMEQIKASAKDIEKELPAFIKSNANVAKAINTVEPGQGIDVVDNFGNQFKLYAVEKAAGGPQHDGPKLDDPNKNINNPQAGEPCL